MSLSMLGQAALGYVAEGFAVFPLLPNDKRPVPGSRGFKDASRDPADIERWWGNEPELNIGIATGAASGGVFVIDVDDGHSEDGHAGSDAIAEWEEEHGELPETRTAVTGSGGRHIFYRCPPGVSVKSSTGVLPYVDVRGDGGYIVAPPSNHPNGNMYAWEDWSAGIAEATPEVIAMTSQGQREDWKRFELPDVIPMGERTTTLFKYASSLQSTGSTDSHIIAAVSDANKARCEKPLTDDELTRTVLTRVITVFPKGEPRKHEEGKAEVVRNSKGVPLATIANCVTVLEDDQRLTGRFKYNDFSFTREVQPPLPWDPSENRRVLTDIDYINYARFLEAEYGFSRIKGMATDAVMSVCDAHRYNPVTTWLDSIEWDGEPRVRQLPALLGCKDTEYNEAVMWLTMLGAVYRAYEPGCKMDYMTVLVGAQGIGKSEFVRLLAHDPDWTTDNFNTITGDDAFDKVRGMWIAEMAELLATKRAKDVEAIKAFITSRVDTFRPKYGKETVQRPRRCIFIGTTNDNHFLTDTTGNRRFLPMICNQKAQVIDPMLFDPSMYAYVEQAWGEVVHRYKTEHPPLRLPEHIEFTANELREQYTEEMPLVGIFERWLEDRPGMTRRGSIEERVCVRELIDECLPDEWKRGDPNKLQNMVIDAMGKLATWVRLPKKMRTRKYGTQRVWVPVESTESGENVKEVAG